MNSTKIKFKKFLGNRNTVTIICAVLGILVLYIGYTMKVNSAIEPINVPYANANIQPRQQITEDNISYMQIAQAAYEKMKDKVIINKDDIINHYAATNTLIPEGSLFYKDSVVQARPNEAVYKAPEGYTLIYFEVTMSKTYVNSILPNTYIDIYATAANEGDGKVYTGKFIENVKVLAVKTSDGLDVFEDSDETRTPAYLLVAVKNEQFINLLKCNNKSLGITLSYVPTAVDDKIAAEKGECRTASKELTQYIEANSGEFTYDEANPIVSSGTENNNNNNNNNTQNQNGQNTNNNPSGQDSSGTSGQNN